MGRFTTLIGALVLVVGACSGGVSSASTSAPTTPAPTSTPTTPAPTTPAPTGSPVAISATVTYDGQACTYAGPAVVPRGTEVTFTMANTPAYANGSVGAGLFVTPVLDGTTWEQVLAWAETRHVFPFPDWMRIPGTGYDPYGAGEKDMGEVLRLVPAPDRSDVTVTGVMTRNLYVVACNTHPDEGQVPYPAILLKVLDGG
jgi:hypothetical protein